MPLTIHGWVEITVYDEPERSGAQAWMGFLNLAALIDVADSVSDRLFGIRRLLSGPRDDGVAAVAGDRGLPLYPSEEVADEIAQIRAATRRTGQEECGGYTFATWREIQAAGFNDAELRESDWGVVFDLVRRLERDERFGPDKIRFVVYYCV
jgi:hypothetical protein